MAFTPTGVEFQARGLSSYLSGLSKADRAQQALGRSASGIGTHFGTAQTHATGFGRVITGLGSGINGIGGQVANLGSSILTMGANVARVGGIVTTVLGATTAAAIGQSIGKAITLDQKLSDVAATMGATKETAGTLKSELKDLTLDLALDPNLTVNANQAAEAIGVLAQNGAKLTDEFGRVTEAGREMATQTVALQNAIGGEFTTSAAIATDVVNLFGLEATEMGKAADGAAGVLVASKFGAEDYAQALAQGGGIVAQYGVSLEDFNTVLAATSSNFGSGSDAGTSFKTLMQRLSNPTDEMRGVMDQYGISLFDANGKMREMKDVVADLNEVFFGTVTVTSQVGGATKEQANAAATAAKNMDGLKGKIATNEKQLQLYNDQLALEVQYYGDGSPKVRQRQIQIEKLTNTINGQRQKLGEYEGAIAAVDGAQARTITSTQQLTEAQRAELAAVLGGADGARILLGLASTTGEEYEALSKQVNKSGQALEMAATRVDSVKGAWDIFLGVIEAVQIRVGDAFLPLIKDLLVQFTALATKAGPKVTEFFTGVGESVGKGIAAVSTGLGKMSKAFSRFGVRGAAVSLLGMLGFSPEEISTITPTIDTVLGAIDRVKTAFETFGLRGAAFSIMGLLGFDSDTMVTLNTIVGQIIATVSGLGSQIATLLSGISLDEIVGALTGIGVVLAGGVFAALVAGLISILTPINLIIAGAALLGAAWAGNWLNIQGITTQAIASITNLFNTHWPMIQAVTLTAWEVIKGVFAGFAAALNPVITQLQTQFAQIGAALSGLGINWSTVWDAIVTATGIVAAGIGAAILLIIGLVAGLATGIASGISATITTFQSLSDNVAGILEGLTTIFSGWIIVVTNLLSGDFAMAWEGFKVVLQGAATFWTSIWTGMLEGVLGIVGIISSTIGGFIQGTIAFFQGMYNELVGNSIIPDLVNGILSWFKKITTIGDIISGIVSVVTAPFEDIMETAEEIFDPDKWFELGESIILGIEDGIKKNMGIVLELLKSLAADALQSAKEAIGFGSPAKKFKPLGESIPQGVAAGISKATPLATQAIQNMGQNLISSADNVARFVDNLGIGSVFDAMGLGKGGRKEKRRIIGQAVTSNFDVLLAGGNPAEILATIQRTAQRFNFPPSLASEFAKMGGFVDKLTGKFKAFQEQIRIENMTRLTELAGSFSSIGSTFAGMLQAEIDESKAAKDEIDKWRESNDKLNRGLSEQQDRLDVLKLELAELTNQTVQDTFAIEKKEAAIRELTGAMDKNRQAIRENRAEFERMATGSQVEQIEFLKTFLDSGAETIRIIGEELGGQFAGQGLTSDIFWDRVSAQEELNRLLEEQRQKEEAIKRQKEAQQKLDFLRAQLDLVKLGRELGIGNLFEGITFGLNASVQDLLNATNNIVEAMVGQINEDLQIHSPSGVMVGIFEQVMAGAAVGMEKGRALLDRAIQGTPLLNGSVSRPMVPVAAGGATYNGPMVAISGVNISNGMDMRNFETRVEAAVERALGRT